MQNNDDIYNSPYGQDPEPPNFLRKYGLRLILIAAVVYGVMTILGGGKEEERVNQIEQPSEQWAEDKIDELYNRISDLEATVARLLQAAHNHE